MFQDYPDIKPSWWCLSSKPGEFCTVCGIPDTTELLLLLEMAYCGGITLATLEYGAMFWLRACSLAEYEARVWEWSWLVCWPTSWGKSCACCEVGEGLNAWLSTADKYSGSSDFWSELDIWKQIKECNPSNNQLLFFIKLEQICIQ